MSGVPAALELLLARVRDLMAKRNLSPTDLVALDEVITEVVAAWQDLAARGSGRALQHPERTKAKIKASIVGFGPLDRLLAEGSGVEDIWIEGATVKYLADGRLQELGGEDATTEAENLAAIRRMLTDTDTPLNRENPVIGGIQVLGGRARLACAIPPVSPRLSANIRLPVARRADLKSLEVNDTLSPSAAILLGLDVRAKGSILVDGETGSGKSTLMAALLATAHRNHRVMLLEESAELFFDPPHGGRLQVEPGVLLAQDLAALIRQSLRMRPDIIAVGEVRGPEAWDLGRAMAVGAGCLSTIHANSAPLALEALVHLSLGAGENIKENYIRRTFGQNLHFVVHCERDDPNLVEEGDPYRHQVTEIWAITPLMGDDAFASEPIFVRQGGLGSPMTYTGYALPPALTAKLERLLPKGVNLSSVLNGRVDPRRRRAA